MSTPADDYDSGAGVREAGNAPVPAGAPLRLPTVGHRGVSAAARAARAKGIEINVRRLGWRLGAAAAVPAQRSLPGPRQPRPPQRPGRQVQLQVRRGAPLRRCPLLRQLGEAVQPEGMLSQSGVQSHYPTVFFVSRT